MEKKFPDLKSLEKDAEGSRISRELTSTFQRLYDYIDDLERRLSESISKESVSTLEKFQATGELVNSFATNLIGVTNPPNPLTGLASGTVFSISAGSGLSGGTITDSGTISLTIGSSGIVQKSDGSQLVDSQIIDDGTDIILNAINTIVLGSSALITIDSNLGLIILNMFSLPTVDPGVSGALWNSLGTIKVSP